MVWTATGLEKKVPWPPKGERGTAGSLEKIQKFGWVPKIIPEIFQGRFSTGTLGLGQFDLRMPLRERERLSGYGGLPN
jgi:hypothetical protein